MTNFQYNSVEPHVLNSFDRAFPINTSAINQNANFIDYNLNSESNSNVNSCKSDDESWWESWLGKIGKKPELNFGSLQQRNVINRPQNKKQSEFPISIAKNSLKTCLEILTKLTKINEELQVNVNTMSSAEWKQKTVDIGNLKENFTKLIANVENTETITVLKKHVFKRKRKRLNQKNKKIARRENFKQVLENNRKIHKSIDQWLETMKHDAERVKVEENINRDIDCVLAEVTKKKYDARKQLSLVAALAKLRFVRESLATQRGEKTSVEDKKAFAINTEKLLKMWENSLKTYSTEEQLLKTMLEKSATDNLRQKQMVKEREICQVWENYLFGPKTVISPDNLTFWALTAAERDMETFIAIRKSWDTFLVPPDNEEGLSLPHGWVLPPSNTSQQWSAYLQH